MKKTKLLMPLVGIATVSAAVIPMVACGPKAETIEKQLTWDNGTWSYEKINIVKGNTYKFSFTPTTGQTDVEIFDVENSTETTGYKVANEIQIKVGDAEAKTIKAVTSDDWTTFSITGLLEADKKVTISFTATASFNDCYIWVYKN